MAKGIMKQPFTTMLRDLKVVYTDTWFLPQDNFDKAVDAWYKALGSFSYDQLRRAFDAYIAKNDKPPAPSQIRDLIFETDTAEERQPQFDENVYWRQNNYWILTELDGTFINEIIAPASQTADEIRAWLTKAGYPSEGTVLKTVAYKPFRPKRPVFDND